MTNILALDASTELCSVALLQGERLQGDRLHGELQSDKIIEKVSDLPRSHADRLLPMVDEVLAEGECNLHQLDAIAFGAGPGSFTGLRICIGIVQGLAFGAELPVVAVSSLEAMALMAKERFPDISWIVPAIDARMKEIYWAVYKLSGTRLEVVVAPRVLSVAATDKELKSLLEGKSVVGVGSGWPLLQQSRTALMHCKDDFYPEAAAIAKLGQAAYHAGAGTDAMNAEPIYLRTDITWKKRERIRG
jgi:tRNA threonylcarbamoyladenosine biosynthesis protein TsaB